ncbi:MAG: GAF domain-containing protein [Chloroflexota bacterium]|nr:GAF domain-containing protein [Chloroflexota bacterium]
MINISAMIGVRVDSREAIQRSFLRVLAVAFAAVTLVRMTFGLIGTQEVPLEAGFWSNVALSLVFCALVYVLAASQPLLAAIITILGFTLFAYLSRLLPAFVLISVAGVIAAAMLVPQRFYRISTIVIVAGLALFVAFAWQRGGWSVVLTGGILGYALTTLFVFAITRFLLWAQLDLLNNTRRRETLLQTTAEVAQFTNREQELVPLLKRAIQLVSERFGHYHVQVFLIDAQGENAELIASTGSVGETLLARQHKLAVGSRSVIGRTTAGGQPVVARDTDKDNMRFKNELLPETRAELAVPMYDGDKVIGALDVQSKDVEAFDDSEIQALQVLANLLASSVRNARLLEQQTNFARQNAVLAQESNRNLQEIQRLNRELTGQVWRDFLRESNTTKGVTLVNDSLLPSAAWTPDMTQAALGTVVQTSTPDGVRVAFPLRLRGEVIGAVEIDMPAAPNNAVLNDIRAVLDRLTVSLENARLYDAAQAASAQETRLNQIASRYEKVTSVEELLRITMQELSQTLGAETGAIRLSATHAEAANGGSAS